MKKSIVFVILLVLCSIRANSQNHPIGIVAAQDSMHNLQVGLVTSVAVEEGKGMQLSGFSNLSAAPFKGMQLSLSTNIASGVERGVQMSGLANVSSGYMRGVQFGAHNYADSLNGSQIGLINVARTHPRGWQVGVLNITHDTIAHKLGLVNINPKTTVDFMTFVGSGTKINGAARFRNRSTYNILGFGTHYMGLDEKFSGAIYYRIGQYFMLNDKLSISGDLGYYHIETSEQNSAEHTERLFSLQARINLDYQVTNRLGAFATIGYGDTRYYYHRRKYKTQPIFEAGLTLRYQKNRYPRKYSSSSTEEEDEDTSIEKIALPPTASHPWWALAQVTGINAGVHLFDRFALNADYAETTLHSWGNNFKHGFVWDNDSFSTNLFMHPYHGNLYFNAARSQGLNFWQAAPYAMLGSLEWEFLGEKEPPAINDLMATTMGGICIGEITNRVSRILLNNRRRGWSRVWREAAATLINPMGGLKRIATGDAWSVRNDHYQHHDYDKFPIDYSITAGDRYLADNGALFRGEHNPYLNLYMEYGDPINEGSHNAPYDFFDAEVTFGFSSNQPIINSLHLLGRLWSTPMLEHRDMVAEFGIYQHFNYYDSKPVKEGTSLTPYRISEAASVGPGLIFSFPSVGALTRIEQRVFLSAILLGGTKSDYYNIIDRDYNMGSGYSVKTKTHLEMRHFGRFILNTKYFHLFTWKGYENKDLSVVNPLYLNSQGDKGSAYLFVITPTTEIDLRNAWSLNLSASYFGRSTYYKHYDTVRARTYEIRLGLTKHF